MQSLQVSTCTALGPEACTLPLYWNDSPGPTVMTSAGPPPPYQLQPPSPFGALSSPLALSQWPVFLSSFPSGGMASPALPSAQDALILARSHQLADPRARTL